MSPSEFDLRAALHEGDEGDLPDAGLIIAKATRMRYERRKRITAIASGIAVTAVVVTGFTLLVRIGSGQESGGSAGGAAASVPRANIQAGRVPVAGSSASAAQGAQSSGDARSSAAAVACPKTFPQQALPGGGGTDQFGADSALFARPVGAVRICIYGIAGTLSGAKDAQGWTATTFVQSLESGSKSPQSCPVAIDEGSLAVYAFASDGSQLRPVTVRLGCPELATNGTAVRYVSTQLATLLPTTPPLNRGSPIKS